MSIKRTIFTALLLGALLGSGCPKPKPTLGRVSDRILTRDAQRLGPALQQAKIPHAARLLEAYLAHFRAQPEARDQALCDWLRATRLTPTAATATLSGITPPSRRRMRAFLTLLLQPRTCREARQAGADAPLQPGIYTFTETKTALSGDTLSVQERWLIQRRGDRVWGWYLRRMDRQSGDGRPYQCSKTTRYGVVMAFRFKARPRRTGFALEETEAYVQAGPCAPRQVRLDRCTLRSQAAGLLLSCGAERQLTRRAPLPDRGPAGGVYLWSGPPTPRADGGRQQVTEQWHLVEQGGQVHGFYTRTKVVTAAEGKPHACNQARTLTRQSLYLLRGERKADKITLHELAALQRPDPCADPKVRLDIYRGTVRGDVLNLSWGEGSQTLRRAAARPSLAMPLQWGLKN